jgi:hypothetical protein
MIENWEWSYLNLVENYTYVNSIEIKFPKLHFFLSAVSNTCAFRICATMIAIDVLLFVTANVISFEGCSQSTQSSSYQALYILSQVYAVFLFCVHALFTRLWGSSSQCRYQNLLNLKIHYMNILSSQNSTEVIIPINSESRLIWSITMYLIWVLCIWLHALVETFITISANPQADDDYFTYGRCRSRLTLLQATDLPLFSAFAMSGVGAYIFYILFYQRHGYHKC